MISIILIGLLVSTGSLGIPLVLEPDGVYYVNMSVGDPPQYMTMFLDTGSVYTAVPCIDCRTCGENHTRYDPKQSQTSVDTIEPFKSCYTEGGCVTGKIVLDSIRIDAVEFPNIRVGCSDEYPSSFRKQVASGVAGVPQFINRTDVGFCFGENKLTLGDTYSEDQFDWITHDGDFSTTLVSVNGVNLTNIRVLFDTGTTNVVAPFEIRKHLGDSICSFETRDIQYEMGECLNYTFSNRIHRTVILGNRFLTKNRYVVFTKTRIGLGKLANCRRPVTNQWYEGGTIEFKFTIAIGVSYVWSILMWMWK